MVLRVTGWQSSGGDQGAGTRTSPSARSADEQVRHGPVRVPIRTAPIRTPTRTAADPYGGGYDQYRPQQYPPTGGFPAQGYGPPPPPAEALEAADDPQPDRDRDHRRRGRDHRAGQPPGRASRSPTRTTTSSQHRRPSRASRPDRRPPRGERPATATTGCRSTTPPKSGLSYQVPPDWERGTSEPQASGLERSTSRGRQYGATSARAATTGVARGERRRAGLRAPGPRPGHDDGGLRELLRPARATATSVQVEVAAPTEVEVERQDRDEGDGQGHHRTPPATAWPARPRSRWSASS